MPISEVRKLARVTVGEGGKGEDDEDSEDCESDSCEGVSIGAEPLLVMHFCPSSPA